MFAAGLFFEREPLQSTDLLPGFGEFGRTFGGIAALVIVVFALVRLVAIASANRRGLLVGLLLLGGLVLAAVCAIVLAPAETSVPGPNEVFRHVLAVAGGLL